MSPCDLNGIPLFSTTASDRLSTCPGDRRGRAVAHRLFVRAELSSHNWRTARGGVRPGPLWGIVACHKSRRRKAIPMRGQLRVYFVFLACWRSPFCYTCGCPPLGVGRRSCPFRACAQDGQSRVSKAGRLLLWALFCVSPVGLFCFSTHSAAVPLKFYKWLAAPERHSRNVGFAFVGFCVVCVVLLAWCCCVFLDSEGGRMGRSSESASIRAKGDYKPGR